jgi:hypothetical protein
MGLDVFAESSSKWGADQAAFCRTVEIGLDDLGLSSCVAAFDFVERRLVAPRLSAPGDQIRPGPTVPVPGGPNRHRVRVPTGRIGLHGSGPVGSTNGSQSKKRAVLSEEIIAAPDRCRMRTHERSREGSSDLRVASGIRPS